MLVSRKRDAPSAARTDISCERVVARANTRFATLVAAMSKTMAAPTSSATSGVRTSPTTDSIAVIALQDAVWSE